MKTPFKLAGSVLAIALSLSASSHAQATDAKVHGKVINPAGAPVVKGDVKLTTDKTSEPKDRKYAYDLPITSSGTYAGDKIAPGDYLAVVFVKDTPDAPEKSIDFQPVTFKAADDKTLDFDMTRAEYLKALTPEERAAIEENKKHNAGVLAENAKIGNINATLTQARADEKSGKANEAVASLKPLTDARPNEPLIWAALGEAQLAAADDDTKAAKTNKQPTNDPAIFQKYADSVTSYQKAIELDKAAKKPSPELEGSCYLNVGQGLAKQGKLTDASAAYENAVKANPASAPTAYFNEAATFFNAQKMPEAAAAADKAIAADPKRPENYYIKGQALIPNATMDAKTNKFVLPPGCLEAYQEYLELVPTGGHSQEVKDLLANLGQPQKSSFKAGRK